MKKVFLIILLFVGSLQSILAKPYTNTTALTGVAITGTLSSECEGYSVMKDVNPLLATTEQSRSFRLDQHYALISLSIPQVNTQPQNASATVEGVLTYEYELNGQILTGTRNITLTIAISASTYKDIDYIKVDKAIKASFQVTQVTNLSAFTDIRLIVECTGEIHRFLNPTATVSGLHYSAPPTRTDGSLADGNLYVSWDPTIAAEYYELEWTYISNQGTTLGTTLTKSEIVLRDRLFKNNSSRVTTNVPGYFIPLVYEKGLILFRVRAVGKNISQGNLTDVHAAWTLEENQTSLSNVSDDFIFPFNGLENSLNWQSSISFAEEGKNKASVSYHDGSLRNRQTVTKMNTDGRAVAGETFYDHNGRPVIQVLPAPIEGTQENNLNYRPHLNVKDGSSTLSKSDYDNATPGQGCTPVTPQLSTTTGASRYYSPDNNFGTNGNTGQDILNKNMIPDAKKYPYTQTHYTNDNTGRISIQSGVGETHKLGSGHETKYMYGAPLQSEISRLFGNQVGLNGHYKKNTVIDANGQVSVSYLDLDGKVIATALAGNNNTGLDDLPGTSVRNVSSDLISEASNVIDSDKRGKTMQYAFAVTTPTPYTFEYDLTAGTHTVACTSTTNQQVISFQLASVFDATINLYNSCGVPVIAPQYVYNTANFGSAAPQSQSISFTVPQASMPIGEYRLVKSIRINQSKLDAYLNTYMTNQQYTCVLAEQHFLANALAGMDLSGCGITCDECREKIDDVIAEIESGNNIELTGEEKANLYDRCNSICIESVTCLSSLYGMVAAMGPDGQYGKLREPGDNGLSVDLNNQSSALDPDAYGNPPLESDPAIVPEKFALSIFNSNNTMRPNPILRNNGFHRADWRRPVKVTAANETSANGKNQHIFSKNLNGASYTETDYKNEDGTLAVAYVQLTGTNQYTPAVVNGATLTPVEGQTEIFTVPLKQLADVKDFLKYWKPHFANYLVPYHPEWSYFVECSGRTAINSFEEKLVAQNTPGEGANSMLFLTPESNSAYFVTTPILTNDPLITTYTGHPQFGGLITRMVNKVNAYQPNPGGGNYTMAQVATMTVNCPDPNAACIPTDCHIGKFKADDIDEWSAFRSMYITERQKVLREISTVIALQGRYYNGCIGNQNFPGSAEQTRMLTTSYSPRKTFAEMQNERNIICAYDPAALPVPYNTQGLPQYVWWGWNWRNICTYHVSGHPFFARFTLPRYISTLNSIFNTPSNDPFQTCNARQAPLYKNKIRAFYPEIPHVSTLTAEGESCFEVVLQPNGQYEYIPTNCSAALIDQGLLMQNANDAREYSRCGQCPITTQIKELTETLIENNVLEGTASNFNCVSSAITFTIGPELQSQVNSSLVSNALLSYTSTYASNVVSMQIAPTVSGNGNPLNLTLDFSNSGLPSGTLSDAIKRHTLFGKLKIASIQSTGTNQFQMKAYVDLNRSLTSSYNLMLGSSGLLVNAATGNFIPSGYQTVYRYEFMITGTITAGTTPAPVNIQSCSFNPVCITSPYPSYVQNFLNVLSMRDNTVVDDNSGTIAKPYQLVTPSTALDIIETDIYETPVRYILNLMARNANDEYTASLNNLEVRWLTNNPGSTGPLNGVLSYTENTVAKSIEINVIPKTLTGIANAVDFNNVRFFANIRPFDNSCTSTTAPCPSNKYEADAVVQEVVGGVTANVFHRVVIEIITKTAGNVDATQPTATSCKKVGP